MLFISKIFLSLFSLPKVSIPVINSYIHIPAGLQIRIRWILDPDSEAQMISLCILTPMLKSNSSFHEKNVKKGEKYSFENI
jgi:hypothetical protein